MFVNRSFQRSNKSRIFFPYRQFYFFSRVFNQCTHIIIIGFLQYGDLYAYLILSTSYYTQLFKRGDIRNKFVRDVQCFK